jgi:hypothetical protein
MALYFDGTQYMTATFPPATENALSLAAKIKGGGGVVFAVVGSTGIELSVGFYNGNIYVDWWNPNDESYYQLTFGSANIDYTRWNDVGCWVQYVEPDLIARVFIDGVPYDDDGQGVNTYATIPSDSTGCGMCGYYQEPNWGPSFSGDIAEFVYEHNVAWDEAIFKQLTAGFSPLCLSRKFPIYIPFGGVYGQRHVNLGTYLDGVTPYNSPTWSAHPRLYYPGRPQVGRHVAAGSSFKPWYKPRATYIGAA